MIRSSVLFSYSEIFGRNKNTIALHKSVTTNFTMSLPMTVLYNTVQILHPLGDSDQGLGFSIDPKNDTPHSLTNISSGMLPPLSVSIQHLEYMRGGKTWDRWRA